MNQDELNDRAARFMAEIERHMEWQRETRGGDSTRLETMTSAWSAAERQVVRLKAAIAAVVSALALVGGGWFVTAQEASDDVVEFDVGDVTPLPHTAGER